MGVLINCMEKGKGGIQAYMYVEIYTQLEGGEKMISTNTFYVPAAPPPPTHTHTHNPPFQLDSWKEHFKNKKFFGFDLNFNGQVTVEENFSWKALWMK